MSKTYTYSDMAFICEQNETILFAKEELIRYSKIRKTKFTFKKVSLGCSKSFLLAKKLDITSFKHDGYIIKADKDELVLASNYPRGVLFAVYSLLEDNGCRFIKAGEINEKIEFSKNMITFVGEKIYNPDFEIRSLANCVNFLDEVTCLETIEVVDWCAKNKLNTFFLHESVDCVFNDYNDKLYNEIKKRGLLFEFGGHGAQNFVSRDLFDTHPDYFIEKNGVRVKEGNFCISSEAAVKLYLNGVKSLLAKSPDIRVLHLWFDDVLGGSWCTCEKCKNITPIEQTNKLIDLAINELKKTHPNLKFDLLLYHDTILSANEISRSATEVLGYWAPRERCYAHSLGSQNCELNIRYAKLLDGAIASFGAKNLAIFEYYTDLVLFSKVKNNLAKTIAEDLKFYYSKGINKVTTLGFGLYSFWAYDLNNYIYAKHLFNTRLSVRNTIKEFISDMGQDSAMIEYYDLLEEFSELYFSFCGYDMDFCDIRRVSLCGYLGNHIVNVNKAREVLIKAKEVLSRFAKEDNEFIKYETKLLDLSIKDVSGILIRMQLRHENYVGKNAENVLERIDSAKKILIQEIDEINEIPLKIKGYNGLDVFVKNMCRTQIWTANELLVQEFGMDIDLDMTKIMEGNYDIEN